MSFGTLLYRYFFFGWLFKDVNRGNLLERAAAWRHNREQARWLADQGGWESPATADRIIRHSGFARFARKMARMLSAAGLPSCSFSCSSE